MNTRKNAFVIGLSVTIATFIVIASILWLGKSNFLVRGMHLKMIVPDANGLSVGDVVLYRGLNVGTVQDARIEPKGVVIDLKLEKLSRLPVDSRFKIKEVSLLGEKAVEIIPGTSDKTLAFGDTVRGESGGGLSGIMGQGKSLEKKLTAILTNIDSLSGARNRSALNALLVELRQTVNNLNRVINGDFRHMVTNLKDISEQNKKPLNTVLDSLARNAGALAKAIRSSQKASAKLDLVLKDLRQGKGTLGQLAKNDSLYKHLDRTILRMDSLIKDIKQNPGRYFEVKVF
ncbi:MAG TPA: MCE family protein [Caldithrix abyssi]|uniref:MCE family protein n=1 Tax=Caldithrix abyssi TaxID=187145 RepID=A0A7V5UDY2_CALAY|nr:MCE family protein [Caldithrix abyssi]